MSGTVDKPLTKADFAERSVPYAVLLRVIDAQEKLTYLKRELSLFFAFMLVFVLYVVQSQPVRDSFFLERAARGALVQAEFASPSDINAPLSFASVADRVRHAHAAVPLLRLLTHRLIARCCWTGRATHACCPRDAGGVLHGALLQL